MISIKNLKKKNLILVTGVLFATSLAVCGAGMATGEIDISAKQVDPTAVVPYEAPADMYATATVNVRSGAGTEFEKIGKLAWGTPIKVSGETGNGWYEVAYKDGLGYVSKEYVSTAIPGVPFLFVGDSRTVQMKTAVGSTDKAYVAKVGEGYSWFKNSALPQIPNYAGNGTTMIINFGVNDLANASKYIKLVNSNIDAWTAAGIKVYYAAVTPVKNCKTVSNDQIERFNAAADTLQAAFKHHIIRHICNSAAIERFPEVQYDMVRLGLGLYGVNPLDNQPLETVCTLKTTILQIRELEKGETVGYSRKGKITRHSRIAAIPIGYADGLDRHLGNGKAYCMVNGQKAYYVGNICMDVCMIDVTDIECQEGDSVEIFGPNLPVHVLSDILGTIPYEIISTVSIRVKRVYYTE